MIEVGTYCIYTNKWEKRACRAVAHDGDSVVIKLLGSGYRGVPERSLTVTTQTEAVKFAQRQHQELMGKLANRRGDA